MRSRVDRVEELRRTVRRPSVPAGGARRLGKPFRRNAGDEFGDRVPSRPTRPAPQTSAGTSTAPTTSSESIVPSAATTYAVGVPSPSNSVVVVPPEHPAVEAGVVEDAPVVGDRTRRDQHQVEAGGAQPGDERPRDRRRCARRTRTTGSSSRTRAAGRACRSEVTRRPSRSASENGGISVPIGNASGRTGTTGFGGSNATPSSSPARPSVRASSRTSSRDDRPVGAERVAELVDELAE